MHIICLVLVILGIIVVAWWFLNERRRMFGRPYKKKKRFLSFFVVFLVVSSVLTSGCLGNNKVEYIKWNEDLVNAYKPAITNLKDSYKNNSTYYYPHSVLTSVYKNNNNVYAIEYWFYYLYQDYPPFSHEHDWEFIYVYIKDEDVIAVAFDNWHYQIEVSETPNVVNNHSVFTMRDGYRALFVNETKNWSDEWIDYSVSELKEENKKIMIDYGIKEEYINNPYLLLEKNILGDYKHKDMWNRKEKYT